MVRKKRKSFADESVSNATVAILLILTIIVSVIGTWSVLQSTDTLQGQASSTPNNAEGKTAVSHGLEALRHAEGAGNVQLKIIQ